MTNVGASHDMHTDTALQSTPQQTQRYHTEDASVFLTQQAADARTAMQRTLADMKASATAAVDVRWWTQQYPWYAVGAAAVLGFVATRKALAPPSPPKPVVVAPQAASASWLAPLFEMLRTTLMTAIIGAVHTSGEKTGESEATAEQSQNPHASAYDRQR